jgi:hypothetical protein
MEISKLHQKFQINCGLEKVKGKQKRRKLEKAVEKTGIKC